MEVHDHFFYGVNRRMILRGRVDVASVQVYAVGVHSVVSSGDPVRIENGKQVEYKLVSENPCFFTVFSQLTDDSCHNM